MKKYGKYEKRPEAVPEKQPEVKNMLLQTYFTSLLCLVLCVTMFFGTSYAWFTSEVNNAGNEIYIGTLDVELQKKGAEGWISLDNSTNKAKYTTLFDGNIRWEPGYTALETIQVVNEGDLAFNYNLTLTDGKITNATDEQNTLLVKAAENFVVYVHTGDYAEGEEKPGEFKDIAESDKWAPVEFNDEVATLADILVNGLPVLTGSMEKTEVRGDTATELTVPGPNDSKDTKDTFIIALHMKEEATNENNIMGLIIGLNVKLTAYQMGSEQDAFGTQHDQMVATAEELQTAFNNGGTVALAADITLEDSVEIPAGRNVVLDLNGHKIAGTASADMTSLITNNGTLAVVGDGEIAVTHDGTDVGGSAVNAISNRGILTINGGKISNAGTGNQIGYGIDNYNGATLTVNGGKITVTGSSYYDGIRLFCGSNETTVTINGGIISSIWTQNPSSNKATPVNGTVIINANPVGKVYYENYTTVKVKSGVTATVEAYGAGSDNTTTTTEEGYTVYSFVH